MSLFHVLAQAAIATTPAAAVAPQEGVTSYGPEFFVAQQEKLTHDAQEDFNKVFGRDFMSAYQSQLRRLKVGK